jgi:phosphatidate cytidylyltransferase
MTAYNGELRVEKVIFPMGMSVELAKRVMTAVALAAGLLAVIWGLPQQQAAIAFGVLAVLAAWEWAGLMQVDRAARVMFGFVAALFCWQIWMMGAQGMRLFWCASALFWIVVAPLWLWRQWRMRDNDFVGYALGIVLITSAWSALSTLHGRGAFWLLAVMSVAWVSDIAAYFVGRACGKHKLAARISPGKSWEGACAGVGAAALFAALAWAGSSPAAYTGFLGGLLIVCAAALLAALGVVADLFESLLKRQAAVKDSSSLLPGHGGILDRIDSQLAILPLAALILTWSVW